MSSLRFDYTGSWLTPDTQAETRVDQALSVASCTHVHCVLSVVQPTELCLCACVPPYPHPHHRQHGLTRALQVCQLHGGEGA
jgi:hypothetical protein